MNLSPIVCYLDESATDDAVSEGAVMGGLVIKRRDVPELDQAWQQMLGRYEIPSGLHMRELGPKGKYAHIAGQKTSDLLTDAVSIINTTRIFTFGASLSNHLYRQLVSENLRINIMSVYGSAFMMCVEINRASAANQGYTGKIDYVLDEGNRFRTHIERVHPSMTSLDELKSFKVGALDFRDDSDVPGLQVADVISWATRRRKTGKFLDGVLSPLQNLFDDCYADSPLREDILRQLAAVFARGEAIDNARRMNSNILLPN